jgi:ketosteroid isomerase-like protein
MGNHEEEAIRRQIDAVAEAIGAKDLEALRRVYAEDVVSYDVEPPLRHLGVEGKLKNWARVFLVFERATYEVRDLTLVVRDDLALGYAFGRLGGTLANGTTTDGMWVRVTFGFRKIDGVWLIAHDHVSVPLDIRSGNGVVDLEP